MGLFSLPSRLPSATSTSTSTSTTSSMPRDPSAHKSRRRSSHSSKSSSAPSISSTGTTIHYPPPPPLPSMARDSTSRTSRSSRYATHPSYAEPPSDSESDDSTSPAIGLFPPRGHDSGSYLPPPAPTPPLVGTAPAGYSYVPVPVYKSTGHGGDDGSDGTAARKSRRRAEKAEKAAAASGIPVPIVAAPQVQALPSTATKLINAPPARAALGPNTTSSSSESKLPQPQPKPKLQPKPGVLQRVRIRAKQSLERLPRVSVPQRPHITIRIPLPNITLPKLPKLPKLPQLPSLPTIQTKARRLLPIISTLFKTLFKFLSILLPSLLILILATTVNPYQESLTLRYQTRNSSGITTFTESTLTCSIDTSGFPSGGIADVLSMRECVDAGHVAWSGASIDLPPPPPSPKLTHTLESTGIWLLRNVNTQNIKQLFLEDIKSLPGIAMAGSVGAIIKGVNLSNRQFKRIGKLDGITDRVDSWVEGALVPLSISQSSSSFSQPQVIQKRLCSSPSSIPPHHQQLHSSYPPSPNINNNKIDPPANIQVSYGATFLLMTTQEKEACWEKCREVCLGRGARAAAVKVECKMKVGKMGKCWAEYKLGA